MWRPKQKNPCEASGEVPFQLRLSREDKGKLPRQFGSIVEPINRKARSVSLPSHNPGEGTPCANLVLTSEVTDGIANAAPVLSRKTRTEALSSASHLRYKAENKAPLRAKSEVIMTSLSKSSSAKSALRSEVKGSSLDADSGAYAASAPKGATRVLSREAGTKALCSANYLCGNAKDEASSRASLPRTSSAKSAPANRDLSKKVISKSPEQNSERSARVSALDCLNSANPDL